MTSVPESHPAADGVIKFRLDYRPASLPDWADTDALRYWFARCRSAALIGRDPDRYQGAAYGNISQRGTHGFLITGTQTGGNAVLHSHDIAWVTDYDITANRLSAQGPVRPSSEAMSHGQVYADCAAAGFVIHVHSPLLWRRANQLDLPITAMDAAYGTPAMADAVSRIVAAGTRLPAGLAMGGHEDGVMVWGADAQQTGDYLFELVARAKPA